MDAMKDSHKSTLTSGKMVALAAGLSVGATVGYIVYRHISSTKTSQGSDTEVSKMTLPVEVYRNISRCQARFLDMVTQASGAHVRVTSDGGQSEGQNVRFLLHGSKEQVLLARSVLQNLVINCEPTAEVLEVPQTAFGRIIGRGGESLKLITRTTGARVSCSKERMHNPGAKGTVTIKGTRQEVKQAKELIVEKVKEDMIVRAKIFESSAQREKRGHTAVSHGSGVTKSDASLGLNNNIPDTQAEKKGLIHANGTMGQPEELTEELTSTNTDDDRDEEEGSVSTDSLSEVSKFEIPSPDLSFQPDEHLDVYVSAYENPNHFWIQILGVRSLQLDKLAEEMNHFYNSSPTEHRVEAIMTGDIVAAPYRDHGTWNRSRVLGKLDSGLVDLYYVDFGDNGELPKDSLRRMRTDFLSLPFQAIECSLAGVRPKGDEWAEAALDDFDRLTYCASWRPLLAKLCSYSHSDMSSWPSVKLYDKSVDKEIDIGEELIRLGHAVRVQEEGKGKTEGEDLGSLQKMLDDVMGASSELSLSCISLSGFNQGKGQQIEDWSSEQPLSSSICYPHIPRTLFSSFTSSVESWEDNVFPGETSDSFYSCLTSNTVDDSTLIRKPSTYILTDPFQSVDYIWQSRDDVRENKNIFNSQSLLRGPDRCSSTVIVDLTESQTDGEENQLETNTSHQQTVGEVCQIRAEEEMSRDWQQQGEIVNTGLMLTDVSSAHAENTEAGKKGTSALSLTPTVSEAASISESIDDAVEDDLL